MIGLEVVRVLSMVSTFAKTLLDVGVAGDTDIDIDMLLDPVHPCFVIVPGGSRW